MSHTPGPWINRGGLIVVDDGAAFNSPQIGDAFKPEDAYLFAASLEMFAALRECADYLDCIPESAAGGDDAAARIARKARAALSKAEHA